MNTLTTVASGGRSEEDIHDPLLTKKSPAQVDRTFCRGDYTAPDVVEPKVLVRWDDLFEVVTDGHPYASNRRYVSLIGNLARRHAELEKEYQDAKVRDLTKALKGVRMQYPADMFESTQKWLSEQISQGELATKPRVRLNIPRLHLQTIFSALEIVCLLESGIGADLRHYPSDEETKKIIKRASSAIKILSKEGPRRLSDWLASLQREAIEARKRQSKTNESRRHHPRRLLPMEFWGTEKKMPLPWLAIEFACYHVKDTLELPSKKALKERLKRAYPELEGRKGSYWSKVWQEAGLAKGLDRSPTAVHSRKKRSKEELHKSSKRKGRDPLKTRS